MHPSLLFQQNPLILFLVESQCKYSNSVDWEKITQDVKLVNESVVISKVDTKKQPDIAALLELKATPTIKIIWNSTVYTFRGELDQQSLVKFCTTQLNSRHATVLPKSYSWLNKAQIQLYYAISDYLEDSISRLVNAFL